MIDVRQNDIHIAPCSLNEANDFVLKHHRHHKPCTGHKFSVSIRNSDNEILGVAICGRPISRYLDDGYTLEINRCCTMGVKNGCSMLYGACIRIAKAMGYDKVITYTLESEDGASLKASNFKYDGIAGGTVWTGRRSGHDNGVPAEMKKRWVYITAKDGIMHGKIEYDQTRLFNE